MKSLRVISALERQLGKARANIDSELTRRKLKKVEDLIKKAVEISIGENMLNPKIAQYYEKKISRVVARLHKMSDVVATVKVAAKAYKDSVETQRKSVMAESAKTVSYTHLTLPTNREV